MKSERVVRPLAAAGAPACAGKVPAELVPILDRLQVIICCAAMAQMWNRPWHLVYNIESVALDVLALAGHRSAPLAFDEEQMMDLFDMSRPCPEELRRRVLFMLRLSRHALRLNYSKGDYTKDARWLANIGLFVRAIFQRMMRPDSPSMEFVAVGCWVWN